MGNQGPGRPQYQPKHSCIIRKPARFHPPTGFLNRPGHRLTAVVDAYVYLLSPKAPRIFSTRCATALTDGSDGR